MTQENETETPYPKKQWIQDRLKELGITQRKLAKELALKPHRITKIIKGERTIFLHEVPVLARILRIPVTDILKYFVVENLEVTPELENTSIIIRGDVQAGEWKTAEELPYDDWEVLTIPTSVSYKPAYGLRVKGDSMDKIYPEGAILICSPYRNYEKRIGDGDHVIVERISCDGLHEATVKELKISDDGRIWLLPQSNNPEHAPLELKRTDSYDDYMGEECSRITGIVVGSIQVGTNNNDKDKNRKFLTS